MTTECLFRCLCVQFRQMWSALRGSATRNAAARMSSRVAGIRSAPATTAVSTTAAGVGVRAVAAQLPSWLSHPVPALPCSIGDSDVGPLYVVRPFSSSSSKSKGRSDAASTKMTAADVEAQALTAALATAERGVGQRATGKDGVDSASAASPPASLPVPFAVVRLQQQQRKEASGSSPHVATMSSAFIPTLREVPPEITMASHKFLIRAGKGEPSLRLPLFRHRFSLSPSCSFFVPAFGIILLG